MSRLGEKFLQLITPYPRLAGFLFYLRNPHVFLAKVWRKLVQLRRERACRALLDGGKLIIEVGEPGRTFFTVATPVWRVAEEHLRAAIESVRRQTYPHWELWLADDASPDPHVRRVLAEAARADARIKVLHLPTNLGIAGASDEILVRAQGDFIAFLDHDDLLHPRALELVSAHLRACPEVDWVFTDEDKVDEDGRHREPCLKPGWSRHLLLTFNYVAHLRVVRRAMLEKVGGHRRGFDGAQDYDLALRVLSAGGRFSHLRGVLYHWRAVLGSMARAAADKPAAHAHALTALRHHADGWPRGGDVAARVLNPLASFFQLRRAAARDLEVTLLTDPGAAIAQRGRISHVLPLGVGAPTQAVVAALKRTASPLVVRWPQGPPPPEALEELLALLQVPGTFMVAPRLVHRGRVSGSGWWIEEMPAPDGKGGTISLLRDPWRGLNLGDPGYLNLALVPGPRAAVPETAWAAWRDAYLNAWQAAEDTPFQWRPFVGCARARGETVVTPTVTLTSASPPPPPSPPPGELPRQGTAWLHELGLSAPTSSERG